MKKLNNKGFGIALILIILVVFGVIGVVGWLVYDRQNSNELNQSTQPVNTESQSTQKIDNVQEEQEYLVLKEWGVKIPLSSNNYGYYYEVDPSIEQSKSEPINLTVYSKEADLITGKSGVSCKGEYVAYMMRLPKDDKRWQPMQNVEDGNVSPLFETRIDVDSYRYAIATAKKYGPTCLSTSATGEYVTDQDANDKFTDIVETLKNDFKAIKVN